MPEQVVVLDPHQLKHIEGVHRGFLYQHLYAVGCLLLAPRAGVAAVLVERDEDIEVQSSDRRSYVQVKTRSNPLVPGDIQDVLQRFSKLREAHASKTRPGTASFWIVSNVAPGPTLSAEMEADTWPKDVMLRWPRCERRHEAALPPAWANSHEAVAWCAGIAAAVPFAALAPETLVWKLAGQVALASSGGVPRTDHAFPVADLPVLFEQILFQLQDFPVVTSRYRPQANEPGLLSEQRVRLISGFSGAGKTAWASQAALHMSGAAAYFDVSDVPGPTVAASLVRELAGRLLGSSKGALGKILLPGASGIEMLRLLDQRLDRDGIDALVVIDNAHRVPANDLRAVIAATKRLRMVLLCQPAPVLREVQTLLSIPEEHLFGWTTDTIAAEVVEGGGHGDYAACQRLRDVTAGLPLYVQSAVRIAVAEYEGDIGSLCADIEAHTHVAVTAQETMLARSYDALPKEARDLIAVLSVADCPLTREEASTLVEQALGIATTAFARAVRAIAPSGFVQLFGNDRLKVHDAVRVLGRARLEELGDAAIRASRIALKDILSTSLRQERDTSRFALFVRVLGLIGDVETLVDLASDEMFHEMGLSRDFAIVLEEAASSVELSAAQRFWALDALTFAELKEGDASKVPERLKAMACLEGDTGLGRREQLALGMKRMLYAAKRGDENAVQRALGELLEMVPEDPVYLRILKYNAACAMHLIGRHEPAKALALELIEEYYEHLGLDLADVCAKNPDDIWPLLKKSDTLGDDLKHLADSLDLRARCCSATGEKAGLARIHAFKFYAMAGAADSALKVGQDLVDEFLGLGDPIGARQMLEGTLLPSVHLAKMLDRVVPLRSQYAVVLAHCGDFDAADAEMARLAPYESGLPEIGKQELRNQRRLVGKLRDAGVRRDLLAVERSGQARKIGRNERCPCGSGKKFKKCHGARG